jgi:hypothetical protein
VGSKKVSKQDLAQFTNFLKEITGHLLIAVREERPKVKWKRAFLDVRCALTEDMQKLKIRVEFPDGDLHSIRQPYDLSALLTSLQEIKDRSFADKWYGMKLTVFPNGKCETEFDYNPACFNDPTWYDS